VGKNQSVRVYFDNMALHFECQINKNALHFRLFFLAILPTGRESIYKFLPGQL